MPNETVSGAGQLGEARPHLGAHALRQDVGAVLVGVGREQGELLPAHARGAVEAALGRAHRRRPTRAQRVVAGPVPELVVDPLEAVEVGHDQAEGASVRRARSSSESNTSSKPRRLRRPVRVSGGPRWSGWRRALRLACARPRSAGP